MIPIEANNSIKISNKLTLLWLMSILLLYALSFIVNLFFHTRFIISFIYIVEFSFFIVGILYVHNYLVLKGRSLPFSFFLYFILFSLFVFTQIVGILYREQLAAFSDLLKLILYAIIFLVTFISTKESRYIPYYGIEKYFVYIPFVLLIIDALLYTGKHGGISSIFYNSNNAAYYAIVSSILLIRAGRYKLYWIYLFFSLILLLKLGALISVMAGIIIYYLHRVKLNRRFLTLFTVFLLFGVVAIVFGNDIGLFNRFLKVFDHLLILLKELSITELANISYGEAISILNDRDADLSFLFRIKQTFELTNTYLNGAIHEMLFGFGSGSVPVYSSNNLVAHNDYVTLLFEYGVLALMLFVVPQLYFLFKIRRDFLIIPFVAIFVYFLLENLYFNFLATALYFFLVAHIWAIKKYHQA